MADPAGLDAFMAASGGQESGGDSTAQNARTGAYGTFQILPSNWPAWSREAGLGANAARTPENQERVARFKMTQYYRQFGSWEAVAVAWYAGPGAAAEWVKNPNQTRFTRGQGPNGTEPSIASYVNIAMSGMGRSGGARTTASTGTSGGTTVATAAPKSRQQILDYIAENYPDYYAVMAINGEVKNVLLTAAEKEWTGTKLRSELAKTKWWRTTSNTARTWDASYAQDKATGEQLLRQTQGELAAQAQRLGVSLSDTDLRKMALNVRRLGWSPQQVAEALAGRFRQSTAKAGLGTATADQLRTMARDYGVGVSDREVTLWTQRLLSGQADEEGWKASLVKRARTLYATIADEIDAGVTVRDYFEPYADRAAQILGLNPEEIDFRDARWQRALAQPTEGGKRTPMDFSQWETELKTNPLYGYRQTVNGKREEASFASAAARAMGLPQ